VPGINIDVKTATKEDSLKNPQHTPDTDQPLTTQRIIKTWLPLFGSWLLMSIELPTINAVVARLVNPEINLAAYGGVVFPISLMIEAPVVMLLAASTALSRDWPSYQRLRRITLIMGGALSLMHFLVAVTPVYYFFVNVILKSPQEVVEPARIGLLCLTPWTLAIAYRRFQQGAMIRFGQSRMVVETTLVRLVTVGIMLTIGISVRTIPGATLAGLTQGLGVSLEALYAGWRVRKIRPIMQTAPLVAKPLTIRRFSQFYLPLALTSVLWHVWQPLISAAVSRMPSPLESLAVWSVTTGMLFVFRTPGVAFNETVVALLEENRAFQALRKFARDISLAGITLGVVFVASPLSRIWFHSIANLSHELADVARLALGLGIPMTVLSVYISLFQGIIVHKEKTGPVAEAVVVFLGAMGVVLFIGVATATYKGAYVASAAFMLAHLAQCIWLMIRSRKYRQQLAL